MKVFVTLLLLVSAQAFAVETQIAQLFTTDSVEGAFDYDEPAGRAWVELTILTRGSDENNSYERVRVPNMRLENGEVLFDVEGQQFVCARLKRGGIFRTKFLKPTGECRFKTKVLKVATDDGFRTGFTWATNVSIVTP